MVPAGGGQYQFSSRPHAVYGGFFPLDPPGQFPPGTNAATPAGPGAMRMPAPARAAALQPVAVLVLEHVVRRRRRLQGRPVPVPAQRHVHDGESQRHVGHRACRAGSTTSGSPIEARYLFTFNGAFSLQFYGDDDLFIFINGRLVLDLGGVHQRLPGKVTSPPTASATITEGGALDGGGTTIYPCPGTDPYTMTVRPRDACGLPQPHHDRDPDRVW